MLNLKKLIKPWSDSGALNANVNLYGFLDEEVFLTKTGDLGVVLSVPGVDYESLDSETVRCSTGTVYMRSMASHSFRSSL
jgi:type IV secretory pathway VirB4 component